MVRRLPSASTFVVESSNSQVLPASMERRKPTPRPLSAALFEVASPVATTMMDWFGSLFRPKTLMSPILTAVVAPKSVSGIHVGGPLGLRKLLVFHRPPVEPAA